MPNKTMTAEEQKKLVSHYALNDLVSRGVLRSGMKVGLGTGSTMMPAIHVLAQFLAAGKLCEIKAVSTSFETTIACEELGIPVYSLNSREISGSLDLAIDGADEIDPDNNLIKGGGAALLLEKIVAYNADQFVILADESKSVPNLGTRFPLPVEVISEARTSVTQQLIRLGATAAVRYGVKKAGPVITDNGNIILDCLWPSDSKCNPKSLEGIINEIVGVVENGFFTKLRPTVYLAHADGTVELR